ncbi:hypothetical protein RFI_07937 [Reticulomyxa filosa]|uniref:EF-hand domain-containing protein n=1 Tax=Reticulomyxa filosa TaxID=46433 RepID=X6NTT1_RETFI|nr:hypothetical protein RFI_07937 [Reticulomyxa filosa]|eukprot:ETO29189.1 hypothetical protein RFI_07937 [Reticulomyxa filosa]
MGHAPAQNVSQSLEQIKKDQCEYEYLTKITHFDVNTLRLLHARFNGIDMSIHNDGVISMEEFARVLGVDRQSLLVQRFFHFIDKSDMGVLNFRNFAVAMSMLRTSYQTLIKTQKTKSNEASPQEKMEFSFFLYDMNNDKLIDKEELRKMVCSASEYIDMHLSEEQIEKLVNDTFLICDKDKNGVIDYNEYCAFCQENPRILQPFTIDVENLIQYELESRRKRPTSDTGKGLIRGIPAPKNNRMKKFGSSVIQKITKNDVDNVEPIHEASDVLRGLDKNESKDETENPSFLPGGGKSSDYNVNAIMDAEVESFDKSSTMNTITMPTEESPILEWLTETSHYEPKSKKNEQKNNTSTKHKSGTSSQLDGQSYGGARDDHHAKSSQ